jgi:hypothetical protein
MDARDVLRRVNELDVRIKLDGERLMLKAPAPLPDELRSEIRDHKPEIMQLLRQEEEGIVRGPQQRSQRHAANGPSGAPVQSGHAGLPHPRPTTALIAAVNAVRHFQVGFWLEGQLLMLQPPPRISPAVHAAMNAMMARREEMVAICSSIARPKGYSDAHWLSAVVDAARLGYP